MLMRQRKTRGKKSRAVNLQPSFYPSANPPALTRLQQDTNPHATASHEQKRARRQTRRVWHEKVNR